MQIEPIAHIRTPYKQKFAIPRQPNLVPQARGEIIFEATCSDANTLRGIEQFSHLWLIFAFHATAARGWSPLVQPPRLGGREKVGVFASRSTFRPNALGMSVVRYLGWCRRDGALMLEVGGVDLLDATPILDIKPYIPYADALPEAAAGYASAAPRGGRPVAFSGQAREQLLALASGYAELEAFIAAVVAQDPRPAYRQRPGDDKVYGMTLYDLNVRWRVEADRFLVLAIERSALP